MKVRYRRFAGVLVALGLLLIAATAVAWAGDPTPTPTPEPTPTATVTITETPADDAVTPTPSPAVVALAETPPPDTIAPRADATVTPTATATATATPTATPTSTPALTATTTADPTVTVTSTPTPRPTGALLTICVYVSDGVYTPLTIPADRPGPYGDVLGNDENIVPAPSGGCGVIGLRPDDYRKKPILLCHATGNPAHPYKLISIPPSRGLAGHENDPGDLVPAPNGTCPGLDPYAVPTKVPTTGPGTTPTPTPTRTPTATATVDPNKGSGGGIPQSEVLAESLTNTLVPTAPTAAREELPFTGSYTWVILGLGFGFLLMGTGMRIIAREPV